MKTITDHEADEWIKSMSPEAIRKIVQEHHALKQGLCYQVMLVPTGTTDWVERSIGTAMRLKRCEETLRKLVYGVEMFCAEARNNVRETSCGNCRGTGNVGSDSCCICKGTGLRVFS